MVTWKKDSTVSECELCSRAFSFITRRHHCRHCGGIFCNACSSHRVALDHDESEENGNRGEMQRVCRACFHRVTMSIPDSTAEEAIDSSRMANERHVKVSVLGAPQVGKTSLIVQLIHRRFHDDYRPSVMKEYPHVMERGGRTPRFHLKIQDAGGVSACDLFQPHYTIGVGAFVIAYAVDDVASFAAAKSIHDRLLECGCVNSPTMLVGNKSDVPTSRRAISPAEGRQTAEEWGALWMEVSAKSFHAVEQVFARLLAELVRREQ